MSLEWRIGWRAYIANGQGSHLAQMVLADPLMADARTPYFLYSPIWAWDAEPYWLHSKSQSCL